MTLTCNWEVGTKRCAIDVRTFSFRPKALLGLEAIYRNDEVVGFIRRGDFGFAIDKSIAYGYIKDPSGKTVDNNYLKEGSYSLESMGEVFPAEIHLKAPFDPKNLRVKGQYS